jgi:hypothetical protein
MPSPMPAVSRMGATVGASPPAPHSQGNGKVRGTGKVIAMPAVLPSAGSALLRQKLLGELAGLASPDNAIAWAREALAAKNMLTAHDAKLVEECFEQKLEELMQLDSAEVPVIELSKASLNGDQGSTASPKPEQTNAKRVDKSLLTVGEPRRYRNKEHLRFITQQPCLLCARKPSDAHHLRFVQPRALGRKSSDEFAVPLCRTHHRAVHRSGDEQSWWKASGIDPVRVALKLWKDTLTSEPNNPVAAVIHDTQQAAKSHQADEKAP